MALIATKSTGTRVQTWLPQSLAEQLRAQAELERRSVSRGDQAGGRGSAAPGREAPVTWEISIPYHDQDESTLDVLDAARRGSGGRRAAGDGPDRPRRSAQGQDSGSVTCSASWRRWGRTVGVGS